MEVKYCKYHVFHTRNNVAPAVFSIFSCLIYPTIFQNWTKKCLKTKKKQIHFSCRGISIWNTFIQNSKKETGLLSGFKSKLKLKLASFSIEISQKKYNGREFRNIKLTKKCDYVCDYAMVKFYEYFFVSCLKTGWKSYRLQ